MSRQRRPSSARNAAAVPARPASAADHAAALAPALLAGTAVHWPALHTFFAQDDITFLSRAAGLSPTPWSMARPLSEGLAWRAQYAVYGLDPVPYAISRLVLHLGCAALVYAAGLRLLRNRWAAGAAALLFAASSIAFTPVHWGACIVELLAAALALGAFVLFLEADVRGRAWLAWAAAGLAAAAVLSKESAIVLPAAFAVSAACERPSQHRLRRLVPIGAVFTLLAAVFVATRSAFRYAQYTGGDAYAMDFSPGHLFTNLCTYLRWSLPGGDAVRDRYAVADPASIIGGVAVLAVVGLLLWLERTDARRTAAVGAGWFVVLLLPVLPLAHHTYLYYLYLPWAGACWLTVAGGQRLAARWPRRLAAGVAVALLAAWTAGEWGGVRAREAASFGPLPADKTVRESLLLRNATAGLRAARVGGGARVGFLNPWPRAHGRADRGSPQAATHSYVPLESAMRSGELLRLFFPGATNLGFAEVPPPGWGEADLFVFDNDGTLTHLGRGAPALAAYGGMLRAAGRGAEADTLLRRASGTAMR